MTYRLAVGKRPNKSLGRRYLLIAAKTSYPSAARLVLTLSCRSSMNNIRTQQNTSLHDHLSFRTRYTCQNCALQALAIRDRRVGQGTRPSCMHSVSVDIGATWIHNTYLFGWDTTEVVKRVLGTMRIPGFWSILNVCRLKVVE
jgi:hypothetical protein